MPDRAQDTEAIRAARDADRIAADFAEIPFEDHDARTLAAEYLLLKGANQWLRDDITVKVETIASLEAERDRLVARLEAAEREVTALRRESELGAETQRCTNPACTIISLGAGYEACPRCGSPLAARAAAAPGETEPTP